MSLVTDQRAQVNITLTGTPEQIRMGYRTLLDSLDDMTDIYSSDAPVWGCHMVFDLDESWRKPHNRDKVQAFLTAELDGFLPR